MAVRTEARYSRTHVGSLVVVSTEPFGGLFLFLLDGFKDVLP